MKRATLGGSGGSGGGGGDPPRDPAAVDAVAAAAGLGDVDPLPTISDDQFKKLAQHSDMSAFDPQQVWPGPLLTMSHVLRTLSLASPACRLAWFPVVTSHVKPTIHFTRPAAAGGGATKARWRVIRACDDLVAAGMAKENVIGLYVYPFFTDLVLSGSFASPDELESWLDDGVSAWKSGEWPEPESA